MLSDQVQASSFVSGAILLDEPEHDDLLTVAQAGRLDGHRLSVAALEQRCVVISLSVPAWMSIIRRCSAKKQHCTVWSQEKTCVQDSQARLSAKDVETKSDHGIVVLDNDNNDGFKDMSMPSTENDNHPDGQPTTFCCDGQTQNNIHAPLSHTARTQHPIVRSFVFVPCAVGLLPMCTAQASRSLQRDTQACQSSTAADYFLRIQTALRLFVAEESDG